MKWFLNMARVFRQEWKVMLSDPALLIFFILLPLAYPIVYTLIYNREVVRQIDVAIVDDCRTEESRELVRDAAATPAFRVYDYVPNMSDAKRLWAEQKVYAILHIPADYSKDINNMEQAHATLFCDMSLLLRYRSLLQSMTGLRIALVEGITSNRIDQLGGESMGLGAMPINYQSNFMGDPQQGFASFVMPGVIVLILQQSMILGVALLGGTWRERRRQNGGRDPLAVPGAGAFANVIGKALAYTVFYIPVAIYILHFIPEIFNLPHYGNPIDYLLFIFPMLLASAFLGQVFVALIREREYVFLVVVFLSVVFLFLSGLTWPRFAMSPALQVMGNLVPATWGVEGFIRINSNAATLAESARPFIAMWIQSVVYCVLAALVYKWLIRPRKATTK